jgi:hypothetical protein
MVERICSVCQHGNPLENRFCGACGASLTQDALAKRPETGIVIAGIELPAAQMRQVTRAVALGAAAVIAEVGLAWLRKRTGATTLPAVQTPPAQAAANAIVPQASPTGQPAVTIWSQRVVEIWEHGQLTRQVVEKHLWRKEQ